MLLKKLSQGKNKNYSGFSFIEGILAVFIISTGMIAVLSLMSSGLRESMDSRDQIIAVLLSQEGIELVRNLRDNNWAREVDTFEGFPSGIDSRTIDYNDTSLGIGGNYSLSKNNSGYFSHNSGGTATKFKRLIVVHPYTIPIGNANLVEIRSVVTWSGGNVSPDSNPSPETCNSSTKCAYTAVVLSRWGGN